jgi:hypothetical protein
VVFPVLVEAAENGINNSLHAFDIAEHHHGARAATHLDEAALDDVGGAKFASEVRRECEKVQQLRQILLQLPDHGRVARAPVKPKSFEGSARSGDVLGQVDFLSFSLDLRLISPANLLQNVAHLVHPAALVSEVPAQQKVGVPRRSVPRGEDEAIHRLADLSAQRVHLLRSGSHTS